MAAILDFNTATTTIVNQSILFPTTKNVGIGLSTKTIFKSKMAAKKVVQMEALVLKGLTFPKMYIIYNSPKHWTKKYTNLDYAGQGGGGEYIEIIT